MSQTAKKEIDMNKPTQAARLSEQLGMRVGVRYRVARGSTGGEFEIGDSVWMEPDGCIMCPAAGGWMPVEDVVEATKGWAIEPDSNWAAAQSEDLKRKLAGLSQTYGEAHPCGAPVDGPMNAHHAGACACYGYG